MFFAQSLGPALTAESGVALGAALKRRFGEGKPVSFDEVRKATADYLRGINFHGEPEIGMQLLVNMHLMRVDRDAKGNLTVTLEDYYQAATRAS